MAYQSDRIKQIPAPLPKDYDRQTNFTDYETINPGKPVRGSDLDAEFNVIEQAMDETQARQRLIQRDDGALINGIVNRDALSSEVIAGVKSPTTWTTGTVYAESDSVIVYDQPGQTDPAWYVAEAGHTATVFADDLAAGRWRLLVDLSVLLVDAGKTQVTTGSGTQDLDDSLNQRPIIFQTEADMVAEPNLTVTTPPITAITLGKTSAGDGEGQTFKIIASGGDVALDNGNSAQIVSKHKSASGTQTVGEGLDDRVARFDSVATMVGKADNGFIRTGVKVETIGYHGGWAATASGVPIGGNVYEMVDAGDSGSRPAEDLGTVLHVTGGSGGLYLKGLFSDGVYKPEHWGAKRNGSDDDWAPMNTSILYTRNAQKKLTLSEGDYLISDTLKTQPDGNYAKSHIEAEGAYYKTRIVCDFKDKAGLLIQGGAARQTVKGFFVVPSAAFERGTLTAARDNISHGVVIQDCRVNVKLWVSNFKGFGSKIISDAGNSNGSDYWIEARQNNYGVWVEGTQDDLSVSNGYFRVFDNADSGFYAEDPSQMRNWDAWIHSENNNQVDTVRAGVQIKDADTCNFVIYSEQGNAANEIYFGATTKNNRIMSFRSNKDVDDSTTGDNVWIRGNKLQSFASSGQDVILHLEGRNQTASSSSDYIDLLFSALGGNNYGRIRGIADRLKFISADGTYEAALQNEDWQINNFSFTRAGSDTLGNPETSAVTVSKSVDNDTGLVGEFVASGSNADGTAQGGYVVDYSLEAAGLTVGTPRVNTLPSGTSVTLSLSASNEVIATFDYTGGLGGSFKFGYTNRYTVTA